MDPIISLSFLLLLITYPLILLFHRRGNYKRLPPGSLGIPVIGQSFDLLRAMKSNSGEDWFRERIRKYGPISKLSLFGSPTIFLHGKAANKFIYTCDGNVLANQQPTSIRRIIGERNLLEMRGDDHRRVRGALVSFLKPEALKEYVGKIDGEIRTHLQMHWHGKDEIQVMAVMKRLTFNIICSLVFGIEEREKRDAIIGHFQRMLTGMLSIPVNIPFTRFNRSLKASSELRTMIKNLINEKRETLNKHGASPQQDLISCLLCIRNEDSSTVLSDEEIVDNVIVVMLAGYDTSSAFITFFIRVLANDPSIHAKVVQEQDEVAKSKKILDEPINWDDLIKMKYTWKVAAETLRITPPIFMSFRKALQDIEYEGYVIPKGWQVVWAIPLTHMDGSIYPNPEVLDPARADKYGAAPPFSMITFGGGPRMCPGMELARIESLLTIHYLVTRFTWKLSCEDNRFWRDPMPVFNQGLPIQIKPRVFS